MRISLLTFSFLLTNIILAFTFANKVQATITEILISSFTVPEGMQSVRLTSEVKRVYNAPIYNKYIINDDTSIPGSMYVGDIFKITNLDTGKSFTFNSNCSSKKMPPLDLTPLIDPNAFNEFNYQSLKFEFFNVCQNSKTVDRLYLLHVSDEGYLNFIKTMIPASDEIIGVPYFSQNVLPWGLSEYDHTAQLGVVATMDRWGCAVTSVAMVLNYHGITQFADGTVINPGTLNEWLKNNRGYSYGFGSGGWFSYLNWNAVSKLTQELYAVGKAPYKLEFNPPSVKSGQNLLDEDLLVGNELARIPNILFVNNNSHFIVAKGKLNGTYSINDPEWNYPTLNSFNNTYSQVKRFVPSHTNLSYITAVASPDVEILITDSQNRKTGKIIQNGQVISYNEIPNANYEFESPIKNPNSDGVTESLGTGVNTFTLPKPENGEYDVTVTAKENANYTVDIITYTIDGKDTSEKSEGILKEGESETFDLRYNQQEAAVISKDITFQQVIEDTQSLSLQGLITQKSTANGIVRNLDQAGVAYESGNGGKVGQNLDQALAILQRERGRRVSERAYQILSDDISMLKKKY